MGEAKRRGTFEQRKAAAIKRNEEEQQEFAAMDAGPNPTFDLIMMEASILMGRPNPPFNKLKI